MKMEDEDEKFVVRLMKNYEEEEKEEKSVFITVDTSLIRFDNEKALCLSFRQKIILTKALRFVSLPFVSF